MNNVNNVLSVSQPQPASASVIDSISIDCCSVECRVIRAVYRTHTQPNTSERICAKDARKKHTNLLFLLLPAGAVADRCTLGNIKCARERVQKK